MNPYYEQDGITIYCGNALEIVPSLDRASVIIADPPYAETNLKWDRWPAGWPALMATKADQMWCFGSTRMFWDRQSEFAAWKLAQDLVWEKHNGSGIHNDRFRRVHELVLHFYQGKWSSLYRRKPVVAVYEPRGRRSIVRVNKPEHWGGTGNARYEYAGTRIMRSVIRARSSHSRSYHPTEKPEKIVLALIDYSTPPGGLVLDPFMGGGTVLVAARSRGLRAIGIDGSEEYCEIAARRLQQGILAIA